MIFTPYYELIDPNLRSWVFRFQTPHTSISVFRWLNIAFGQLPTFAASGVVTSRYYVTAEDSHTSTVYVYRPKKGVKTKGVIFWIHGGGDVGMTGSFYHMVISPLATQLGCIVVSSEYRLGPKYPYPCALNDVHAVYTSLLDKAEELGVDPTKIVVAGDSYGGLLAASLCQRLADERGRIQQPVFQLLTYPMLDSTTSKHSDPSNKVRGHVMWTEPSNRYSWKMYLRTGGGPYAVPSKRQNLEGLPPTWIGVGDIDVLYLEAVDYAKRLEDANIPTELVTVKGAFHGFDFFTNPTSDAFNSKKLAALRRYLYDEDASE